MKNELLKDLSWRGLINDCTDLEALDELLNNEKVTLYIGFDPTADSLHIGHLLPIIMLKRFQDAGHKPLPLIGGATGLIGDPSGRSSERQLNTVETVLGYVESIKRQMEPFLSLDGENAAQFVNNYDWTKNMSVIEFLRDFGKNFGINYMLAKDTIASRLESGISYTEFSYTILQAMDFKHLYENYHCQLQVGGSDQWGNITSGLELIRKTHGSDVKVIGLTVPLVTKADGTKFGKSASGAVWLDPKKTSPYEMYQFFINTSDDDVVKFLKIFTFLSQDEIKVLEDKVKTEPHLRAAQKSLAKEVVTFVHGPAKYEQALKITDSLFNGDIKNLNGEEIEVGFKGLPSVTINDDMTIIDLLVEVGAARSKREAREFVSNNSISINGEKITDLDFMITKEVAIENKYIVLRRGKKNYFVAKFA